MGKNQSWERKINWEQLVSETSQISWCVKYHDSNQSLQNWENTVDPFEEATRLEKDASDKIIIKCKRYKNKTGKKMNLRMLKNL